MDNLRILFVCSSKYLDKNDCSQTMHQAFEVCKQNVNASVSWVKELELKPSNMNKTDFIVFEEFEGKLFEELKNTRSTRILGPMAVIPCLMDGKPIPNYNWPIYNVAMYKCIVTCSHLTKNIKAHIKNKVELMGGCYVDNLVEKNTHLVTGSAKSEKYLVAAEAGVKLMCPSWIEDVWNSSQTAIVHADDDVFNKHKCLPFHNLTISSTGITNPIEKQEIEKKINENGGNFSGKLALSSTDILICSGDVLHSEKYKAARQCSHIKCVNINWVTDSIAKGYALPHTLYQVQKITSTPNKSDKFINPEFSMLSAIGGANMSQRTCVDETLSAPTIDVDKVVNAKRKAKEFREDLIDNLDIKKAKMAGEFLDGCSVYLAGFTPDHIEKLNKIINLGGATRYDTFSDRVTHVIVGDPTTHEVSFIKSKNVTALMVSLQWLIVSMEEKQPVYEEKYLIGISDLEESSRLGSPLSKKGLTLLRSNRTVTEKEIELNNEDNEEEMQNIHTPQVPNISDTLGRLLQSANNINLDVADPIGGTMQFRPSVTSTQESSISVTQDLETSGVFQNFKFLIIGFEEEDFSKLKLSINNFGGDVVSKTYKGIPDYAVVPIFNKNELHHTASEVVNDLFVSDCIRVKELILNVAYYHRPFNIPDTKPVENSIITVSNYVGTERLFLLNLIDALGGMAQEQLVRIRTEKKGFYPSTHLVSPEAKGKKYDAAIKWGLPVVSKEWLLECAKTGKRVPEADFLLGESTVCNIRDELIENTPQRITSGVLKDVTPTERSGSGKSGNVLMPVNNATPYHKKFLNNAEKFSPVTPVNTIMKKFRESNLNQSQNVKETKEYAVPPPWAFVKTPETPLGAFLTPNPSPGLRKQFAYWLDQFPNKPSPSSNKSTPLSELKRQLAQKVTKISGCKINFGIAETNTQSTQQSEQYVTNENENNVEVSTTDGDETPDNQSLASRLQMLEDMLSASGSKRQSRNFQSTIPVPVGTSELKDSQPCTVGWDFRSQEFPKPSERRRVFSLSGIGDDAQRARMVNEIEQLGSSVSNLANYDPSCTHLLCLKPARNEKALSCMAAGKWILHISYLEKSVEAGHFLDEEEYEFGNPKSKGNFTLSHDVDIETRMQRMLWWRKEVSRRGYGAFNDMRAIIVANKREPIIRVIEAGGGVVVDLKPPFDDSVNVTHCLLEQRSVDNFKDYIPLAKQGVYLVNTIYISDYLHNPNKDIHDCILPYFCKYYARN